MTFVLSPIVDNLTAALVMCAVVLTVGRNDRRFIGISCVRRQVELFLLELFEVDQVGGKAEYADQ